MGRTQYQSLLLSGKALESPSQLNDKESFQGNWHDLNEFFEYTTEWEPSASLYFGDNILQDILAPNKFTKNCDSVAVSEELIAEGMVGQPPSHKHSSDLVSSFWGSYFYHPEPKKPNSVLSRASSFAKRKQSVGQTLDLLREIWGSCRDYLGLT